MADRTANTTYATSPRAGRRAHIISDGITLGIGALVQLQGGYLNHWDETATFRGLLIGGEDRAGDGVLLGEISDSIPPKGFVDESGVTLKNVAVGGTPAQVNCGALVFCADSDIANLTITDTTNPPVGYLAAFRSVTDCDVTLFTPEEHAAGIADATWNS